MEVIVGTIIIYNLKMEEITNAGQLADFIHQLSERLTQAEEDGVLHDQISSALGKVKSIGLSSTNIAGQIEVIFKEHQIQVEHVKR